MSTLLTMELTCLRTLRDRADNAATFYAREAEKSADPCDQRMWRVVAQEYASMRELIAGQIDLCERRRP